MKTDSFTSQFIIDLYPCAPLLSLGALELFRYKAAVFPPFFPLKTKVPACPNNE